MGTPAEDGTRSRRGPALRYQIQGIYYLPPCTSFPLLKRDQEIVAHHMNKGYGFPSAHFDHAISKFRKLSIPLESSESSFRSLVAGMYPKLTGGFNLYTVSKGRELEIIPAGVCTLAWLKAQGTKGYRGVIVIKDSEQGGLLTDSEANHESVLHDDPQHNLVGVSLEMSLATGLGDSHPPSDSDKKTAAILSDSGLTELVLCAMTSGHDAIKSEEIAFETSLTRAPASETRLAETGLAEIKSVLAETSETSVSAESETSFMAASKTAVGVMSQTSSEYVPGTRLAVPCTQNSGKAVLKSRRGRPKKKWSLEISSEIYDRWCAVGVTEGVTTDSDIARFLVQMYEHVCGAPHLDVTCADCNSPLRYVCTKCCSDCHKPEDAKICQRRVNPALHSATATVNRLVCASTDAVIPHVHADTGNVNSTGGCVPKRVKSENVDVSGKELSSSTVRLVENLNTSSAISEEHDGSGESVNDYMLDTDTEAVSSETTTPSAENIEEELGPPNSHNRKRKSKSQFSKSKCAAKKRKMFGPKRKPGPKKKIDRSLKQPRPATHVCEHCGRSFISPGTLAEHMLLHTGEKPHVCQICNASFRVKRQLKLHKQARHSGQRPYLCPFCGNAYSREGTLNVHLRKHKDKKSFICNVCSASFMIKSQLKIHNRIHTDLRPFPCTECGFAFREKSKLKEHMRTHTGEKPFKCSQCSAAFGRKKNLIFHERRHNQEKPFRCEVCNYACVDAAILKVHSRVHTGEKNYVCSVCDAAFAYNSALKNHMKRHRNHMLYTCNDCGVEFQFYLDLKRHIQQEHNVNKSDTDSFVPPMNSAIQSSQAVSFETQMNAVEGHLSFEAHTGGVAI